MKLINQNEVFLFLPNKITIVSFRIRWFHVRQMNNLVYRVYPLSETMKEYIWNFGALDELDESQYIGEMLK